MELEGNNETHCRSCKELITGNFCANCGQKRFERIDKKYIINEIQQTVIQTDKGFFYTIKNLLVNIGKTAREYIDGNRVNHYRPLALVLILAGISTFISFQIIGLNDALEEYYVAIDIDMDDPLSLLMVNFKTKYNSLIMLCYVPLYSICTKLAFREWGHNYYEHVVINAFVLSLYMTLCILITYPVMYIFREDTITMFNISFISIIFYPIIYVWFFKNFYYESSLKTIIGRVLLIMLYILISYILIIIGIVFSLVLFYI